MCPCSGIWVTVCTGAVVIVAVVLIEFSGFKVFGGACAVELQISGAQIYLPVAHDWKFQLWNTHRQKNGIYLCWNRAVELYLFLAVLAVFQTVFV